MNDKFEQRIQSIEHQLKEIRKELEESLALGRYHSMESVLKETEDLDYVEIREGWYE